MDPVRSGWYQVDDRSPDVSDGALVRALQHLDTPFAVVRANGKLGVATGGRLVLGGPAPSPGAVPTLAWVPALPPHRLGDPSFQRDYGVRVNYVAGAMANGIGSAEIVIAMAKAGMLGFFGAAGLNTARIEAAVDRIQREVGSLPYGFNLIHSPHEPHQEQQTVELYLQRGIHVVSTSAYMGLTPSVVQFRATGMKRRPDGSIEAPNKILAKVSREEVAIRFLEPPPASMLDALVAQGRITAEEARLAAQMPMADDLTAEAASGGHTDNQAAPVLLPLLLALRDRICQARGYAQPVRVGAAGGIGSPAAVAGAFAMGAAYIVTGSVNQACIEAGTSDLVKQMLTTAAAPDVGMAPASDMFERGVQVQVLKRGTLFAMRAQRLYTVYREYDRWDDVPDDVKTEITDRVLQRTFDAVWNDCRDFFAERDPSQVARAEKDARHKMALVFRWYLGLSSHWAIAGDSDRRLDAQVWCGPAIGAFNSWTRDTFLAEASNRTVVGVAANLMAGAAALTRARWLLHQGVDAGMNAGRWIPRPVT